MGDKGMSRYKYFNINFLFNGLHGNWFCCVELDISDEWQRCILPQSLSKFMTFTTASLVFTLKVRMVSQKAFSYPVNSFFHNEELIHYTHQCVFSLPQLYAWHCRCRVPSTSQGSIKMKWAQAFEEKMCRTCCHYSNSVMDAWTFPKSSSNILQ